MNLLTRHTVQTGVEDRQGFMLEGNAERSVEATLGHLRVMDGPAPAQTPAPLTLEDLYRQHRMRLVRLAILLVDEPATAEDVVQEAFTGLHRNWGRLRDAAAAVGYLRTAVVNGSRSVLRRRKTAREYVPPARGQRAVRGEPRDALQRAPGGRSARCPSCRPASAKCWCCVTTVG